MERGSGRIVENKKRPISWGYLVGSGYTGSFFSVSSLHSSSTRERGENFYPRVARF